MIKSMTGYGRAQQVFEGFDITVELKSVNHRYFECSCRLPRNLSYLEEKIKALVGKQTARGKVDVYVTVLAIGGSDAEVEVNETLAQAYVDALRGVGEKLSLVDDMSLSALARFSDIFTVKKAAQDEQEMWRMVGTVADEAVRAFVAMREHEGKKLADDMLSHLAQIEQHAGVIAQREPQAVAAYRERLFTKLREVLENRDIDEQRVLTEAAIFAERTAINEELVRLESHIAQFRTILGSGDAVGRKLDFLTQELNREINTIGSKASDLDTTNRVVECKSELEKIREQVQNIE